MVRLGIQMLLGMKVRCVPTGENMHVDVRHIKSFCLETNTIIPPEDRRKSLHHFSNCTHKRYVIFTGHILKAIHLNLGYYERMPWHSGMYI